MLAEYESALMEYVENGFAESRNRPDPSGYFLPHSGVIREKSATTKLRIVFDGSARQADSCSLNDLLLRGPDLNSTILRQLLLFRTATTVAVANIEKAFLQIEVESEDRKYLQFLWMKNGKLLVFRMKVLPFGLICSPAILATALKMDLNNSTGVAKQLADRFYVDDLIIPASSIEQIMQAKKVVTHELSKIHMTLRKWHCSNKTLEERWNEDKDETEVSVLGLTWKLTNEELEFPIKFIEITDKLTRADVLSFLAGIYDPLGILAPALLPMKAFCQQLAKAKINWKTELTVEHKNKF